ncbi:hypothetical protein LZK73_25320 (plasmid) [Neorhizobium galegae]|nr:hypothetical protein LZK73_25320 [Neorhizobium galegae]
MPKAAAPPLPPNRLLKIAWRPVIGARPPSVKQENDIMIRFEKKVAAVPLPPESETNRFDEIRGAAVEGHKKSAEESARRRSLPAKEEDRLI